MTLQIHDIEIEYVKMTDVYKMTCGNMIVHINRGEFNNLFDSRSDMHKILKRQYFGDAMIEDDEYQYEVYNTEIRTEKKRTRTQREEDESRSQTLKNVLKTNNTINKLNSTFWGILIVQDIINVR